MDLFFGIYVVLFGLLIGSFLNVLIYRIPLKMSVVKGHSICTHCEKNLKWFDLIPLFSYLFLLGKCRQCGTKICLRYPLVELLNAILFTLIYVVYGLQWISLAFALVSSCLIVLSFIDIDHGIIPDRFNIIIAVCGLILAIFSRDISWLERLIGLFAISVPLLLLGFFTGGVGEGDIKLFAALGLLLGWKLIILTLLIAALIAALYGAVLLILKKAGGKSQIPFGPFIALGGVVALLWGNPILDAYLSMFIA